MTADAEKPQAFPWKIIGIVFLGMFFLICCVLIIVGAFFLIRNQTDAEGLGDRRTNSKSGYIDILGNPPILGGVYLTENFSSNDNNWENYYTDDSIVRVADGEIALSSLEDTFVALGYCQSCADLGDNYFVQAEFSAGSNIEEYFGFAFNVGRNPDRYYVFDVIPDSGSYTINRLENDAWGELASGETTSLHPYPEKNVLGVYYNGGEIRIYANGNQLETVVDENPLPSGYIGIYVNDMGLTVYADDLIIYK